MGVLPAADGEGASPSGAGGPGSSASDDDALYSRAERRLSASRPISAIAFLRSLRPMRPFFAFGEPMAPRTAPTWLAS